MAVVTDESGGWRLLALERRVEKLEGHEPAVISERVEAHTRELAGIRQEMIALKRALYAFAFSIAGSAIAFAIAVLQLTK